MKTCKSHNTGCLTQLNEIKNFIWELTFIFAVTSYVENRFLQTMSAFYVCVCVCVKYITDDFDRNLFSCLKRWGPCVTI